LIKSLYLKGYTAERFTEEFPENSWTKRSVNRLLNKLRDTGTVDGRPGSGRPRSACTEENVETVNDLTSRCLRLLKYFKYSVETLNNKYINTLTIQLHA